MIILLHEHLANGWIGMSKYLGRINGTDPHFERMIPHCMLCDVCSVF